MSLLEPVFLESIFQWMEALPFSAVIRNSLWLNAVINAFHLIALAVFLGAVALVDLRLLGAGPRRQPLPQVARDAHPWLVGGFLGLLATGIPQMMATAMKEFYSPLFWLKMWILLVATIFTFTIRHRIAHTDEARMGRLVPRLVAIASIALWLGVAIPARLIGLLS
jgi:hypothetical protein